MVMTCPDDPACPFRAELHFPMKTLVGELPSGQFNIAYSGDGQAGYPVLIAPFLISLRFMGFHVFLLLTRVLCSLGIYVLLRRVIGGHAIPLLLGAVVMLNPVALSMITFNENLVGLALATAAAVMLLDDGPGSGRRTFAAGLVLGSLLGVRHVAVTSVPAAVIYLAISCKRGRCGPMLMLLLTGAIVTLLPYLYWHRFVFGDMLVNELAYRNPLYDYVLPLLGLPFRSRLLFNWPFHDTVVRPLALPFPTPVLLMFTLLSIFGVALTAVGVLGALVLARERPYPSLFLALWFIPTIALMGLITDWSYDKCTFVYIVVLAPAVWIGVGLNTLVQRMDARGLVTIVAATIMIMSLVQWMGAMDVPADDRYSKNDADEDTLALRRDAWTSVPLLHGGFRPSEAFIAEFPFWSGSRVFRWRDVLDYNHDRSSFSPCSAYMGPMPGFTYSTRSSMPLVLEGRPFIREYVMNSAFITEISPPRVQSLPFNELHFQRLLTLKLPPPTLVLVRDPGRQDSSILENRLTRILVGSPNTPVLILPGNTNPNPSKSPDILTDMAPVRRFEGKIKEGTFPLADEVLSRPGAIRGRLIPELMVDAEIVWRYEDDVPLLVRRSVNGRDTWFLNALLEDDWNDDASIALHEVLMRITGSAARIALDLQGDVLSVSLSRQVNSAAPDHDVPLMTIIPVEEVMGQGLTLNVPLGVGEVRLSVDGEHVHTSSLGPGDQESPVFKLMSGPVPIGWLEFKLEDPDNTVPDDGSTAPGQTNP